MGPHVSVGFLLCEEQVEEPAWGHFKGFYLKTWTNLRSSQNEVRMSNKGSNC